MQFFNLFCFTSVPASGACLQPHVLIGVIQAPIHSERAEPLAVSQDSVYLEGPGLWKMRGLIQAAGVHSARVLLAQRPDNGMPHVLGYTLM